MAKKKLLTSMALTAGLLGGGAAGLILGVPSVSGAQTTTVPDQPATTVPGDEGTAPDRAPRGDGENCPDKEGTEGEAPASSSTNAGFRGGPGGRV
jgi:hypothetical protein